MKAVFAEIAIQSVQSAFKKWINKLDKAISSLEELVGEKKDKITDLGYEIKSHSDWIDTAQSMRNKLVKFIEE